MRLTIDEYSKHFKMSKEMIHSKLRAKKINYIIEDNTTYIIVTKKSVDNDKHNAIHKEMSTNTQKPQETSPLQELAPKPKTTVAMILSLYQKENQQLKEKIVQLETKIDKLIDDKEQMLRDEMSKIEQVYSTKDEQLKTILELMSTKLIAQQQENETIHEVETYSSSSEAKTQKLEKKKSKKDEIVELKEYIKSLDLENYERKVIKKRFLAVQNSDVRVIKQNGKLFLNFSKYDYSDLLDY